MQTKSRAEYFKEYRRKNKEKVNANSKRYREKNKELIKAKFKAGVYGKQKVVKPKVIKEPVVKVSRYMSDTEYQNYFNQNSRRA